MICTFSYLKLAVFFCIVETKFKCFFVVGDKFSFTTFEYMSECIVHAFYFDCACCANNCTQHYQVSQFGAAESVCCDSVSRNRIYFYAFFNIQMICCAQVSVDNQRTAFFYNVCKFIQGRLVFQTKDHSASQVAVWLGDITQDQVRFHQDRCRILRALGQEGDVKVETGGEQLEPGTHAFLLCTDGFWEYVLEEEMEETLSRAQGPKDWLERMRARLNQRAPSDCDNNSAAAVWLRQ